MIKLNKQYLCLSISVLLSVSSIEAMLGTGARRLMANCARLPKQQLPLSVLQRVPNIDKPLCRQFSTSNNPQFRSTGSAKGRGLFFVSSMGLMAMSSLLIPPSNRKIASALLLGGQHKLDECLMDEVTNTELVDLRDFNACHRWTIEGTRNKVVAALLMRGADPNYRDKRRLYTHGYLHYATHNRMSDLAALLLKYGAHHDTSVFNLLQGDDIETARVLKAAGVEYDKNTLLSNMVRIDSKVCPEMIKLLDLNVNGVHKKYNPLLTACFFGRVGTIEVLLEAGAATTVYYGDNSTPLHLLIRNHSRYADAGFVPTVRALIKHGCPIDAVDVTGKTALDYAQSLKLPKTAQVLLEAKKNIESK